MLFLLCHKFHFATISDFVVKDASQVLIEFLHEHKLA